MLSLFILSAAVIAGLMLAGRWYVSTDTKNLLKVLRWLLLGIVFSIVLFFIFSGRLTWAFAALPALLPWFFRLRTVARAAKTFSRMRQSHGAGFSSKSTGRNSNIETRYLRMCLDNDTGVMDGEVIAGPYIGQFLDNMSVQDLIQLRRLCDKDDPESGRVLEVYLDRRHPDWREENSETSESSSSPRTSAMGRAEAIQILGLREGFTKSEIKQAHRRLISGMHPDHGGSNFLAAQINRAKDVLLKE